jgi:hypothetical protein
MYVALRCRAALRVLNTKTTRVPFFEILTFPLTTYYKGEPPWNQNVNAVSAAHVSARTAAINFSRNTTGV